MDLPAAPSRIAYFAADVIFRYGLTLEMGEEHKHSLPPFLLAKFLSVISVLNAAKTIGETTEFVHLWMPKCSLFGRGGKPGSIAKHPPLRQFSQTQFDGAKQNFLRQILPLPLQETCLRERKAFRQFLIPVALSTTNG